MRSRASQHRRANATKGKNAEVFRHPSLKASVCSAFVRLILCFNVAKIASGGVAPDPTSSSTPSTPAWRLAFFLNYFELTLLSHDLRRKKVLKHICSVWKMDVLVIALTRSSIALKSLACQNQQRSRSGLRCQKTALRSSYILLLRKGMPTWEC